MENLVESPAGYQILRWCAAPRTIGGIVCATVRKGVIPCRKSGMSGSVSTHLKVEEAERLKFFCNRRGISKYFLIQQLLREAMAAEEA